MARQNNRFSSKRNNAIDTATFLAMFIFIPGTFWFVRFDGLGKIVDDEEKNADIAVATASIFDEVSGDFSAQKPVKLNRLGYTIATSLTNPFYGMSEAALAQTSSTCSSGGSTSTSLCPSGCQHSCLEYITFTPGQLPPGNYTGWELEYGYNLCCTAKICQNGNWVDYPFENKYE